MSFVVTRVYRPNDPRLLPFGIGTTWPFGMYISGVDVPSLPLVMANGTRIYFDNVNNNVDHGGIFVNSTKPGVFFGAELDIVANPLIFTIRRRDGTVYTFDGSGNLTEIRSRTGAAITITRTGSTINQITSPSGRWLAFTYNASGLISQVKDHTGRTVLYGYTNNRLTSVTNVNGDVWSYTYDANGRMSTVVDPRHNTMLTNTYDANGRVATQTYADGSSIQFSYTLDTNANVIQTDVTDRNGSIRRVQLSSTGDIQQEMLPLGAPEQQTFTFTHDPISHLLMSTTDALNRRTDYAYDTNGNVLSMTRLAGTAGVTTTAFTYEPTFNQVTSVTDPIGRARTLVYDAAGNLMQTTDPLGHSSTFTYNALGQVVTVTNALNQTTTYSYDAGLLASVTDPLNRTTHFFNDAVGRRVQVTNPVGSTTSMTYDVLDRIVQTTDANANSVNYEYDGDGNLTAYVDPRGNRNVYTFDAMNRLVSYQDALLHSDVYAYDQSSRLKQLTDRVNQVTGLAYDGLHRRTQVGFGATPANPTGFTSTIGYAYDAGNRLLSTTDSVNGAIARSYDGLNRLIQEATPNGTVTYTYYANGLRQTMTVVGQATINYAYDNANRLTSITQGSVAATFSYDDANRRTQIALSNGVTANYGYDSADQLLSIIYKSGGTTIGTLLYNYDGNRQRINVSGSFAAINLPSVVANATYNAKNQVINWNGESYTYDLDGSLTGDGTQTYAWNARRQLSNIALGTASVASYAYDGFGRRSGKTFSGTTTSFVYDGANFVQEIQGGKALSNLITGLSYDEVYVRQTSAGNEYLLSDALNTIFAITDASGAIATNYSYEAYGSSTQAGAASTNSQGFTGRELDTGTGLLYYRARYYAGGTGRFISEDPTGLRAGPNFYTYAAGNPVRYGDPSGTRFVEPEPIPPPNWPIFPEPPGTPRPPPFQHPERPCKIVCNLTHFAGCPGLGGAAAFALGPPTGGVGFVMGPLVTASCNGFFTMVCEVTCSPSTGGPEPVPPIDQPPAIPF
jgi:RHS repeat-associated protein